MGCVENFIGICFSICFYFWFYPDMASVVRIGLNRSKVNCLVYIGSAISLIISACLVAPTVTHRTNAIAGNMGMAVCSMLVIVNHYVIEIKWQWNGVMYILNASSYVFFLGLALRGQNGTYDYNRERVKNIVVPFISNAIVTTIMISIVHDTLYADVLPCISFGVHTAMAILAQECGRMTYPQSICALLKRSKQDNKEKSKKARKSK